MLEVVVNKKSDIYAGGITWVDQTPAQDLPEDPRLRLRILAGKLRDRLGLCQGIFLAPLETLGAMLPVVVKLLRQVAMERIELLSGALSLRLCAMH
jgi:hypothetical protein